MVRSIRYRRLVSNGGPHLSVAYDLTCFVKNFKHGLNMVQPWSKIGLFKGLRQCADSNQ